VSAHQEPLAELIAKHPKLADCRDDIAAALARLAATFEQGGKLLLCGNGGSAADCEHIAGELLKGFERRRPLSRELQAKLASLGPEAAELASKLQQGLPAISLVGQVSLATACANDIGPATVFAQLVVSLGRPGDALLAISTSGDAQNVLLAAQAAKALGMLVIGLTGRGGGKLRARCDVCIRVPAETPPDAQELHVPVYHCLCRALEARFFAE
jgi:D-sedoheptulose 7-phosphate isomerase